MVVHGTSDKLSSGCNHSMCAEAFQPAGQHGLSVWAWCNISSPPAHINFTDSTRDLTASQPVHVTNRHQHHMCGCCGMCRCGAGPYGLSSRARHGQRDPGEECEGGWADDQNIMHAVLTYVRDCSITVCVEPLKSFLSPCPSLVKGGDLRSSVF